MKRFTISMLLGCLVLGMLLWGTLAIAYSNIPSVTLRTTVSWAFALGNPVMLLVLRPRRRAVWVFVTVFAGVLLWWLWIPPAHERDWQPDVAVLPGAEFDGDKVIIHHIRNNDYRTEHDYTVQHYTKTFLLSKLRTADLYISFWESPYIAHTIMSFGFEDDTYVAVSIETRKTKDEAYSAIKGFFKQYEVIYVVSDERDVIRLRTNYRGEDVYLYRLNASPELVRQVFLDYLTYINHLAEHPQWYNALTHNCTTAIRGHVVPYTQPQRWLSWPLLLNGYLDGWLYEVGAIDQRLAFPDLKARSRINDRAYAANDAPDFSQRIRVRLPGVE